MMQNELSEITTAQARPLIAPKIQHLKLRQTEPDFDALNFLCTSTNLIVPVGEDQWIFAHAMFREYLAALELRRQKETLDWRTLVQKEWWRETLLFYAAIDNATPIIQAALDLNTVPALALAARCLDETHEVDPEVQQRLSTLLRDALEDDDPQRFRLAAEVRLARRLQASEDWYMLDDQRSISADYITCAEYQLFLDEMRTKEEYYQPDHWTDFRFTRGQADTPVAGVRGSDAEAFCAWLNARQQGSMRYRLPTPNESQSYPARQHEPPLSAWCRDSEGNLVLDRPRPYNRDDALERACARMHEKNLAIYIEIASEIDHAHARARDFDVSVVTAIEAGDYNQAHVWLNALSDQALDAAARRQRDLLKALLTILIAPDDDIVALRRAWREYAALLLLYVWLGYTLLDDKQTPRQWWRWWQRRRTGTAYQGDRDQLLAAYIWLDIVQQREAGMLHAYEGIRLVREPEG